MSYHFSMVADTGRNAAFDHAIRAAVAAFRAERGRPPRVLDIGSGSGLLAMMAARAGCTEVHSLEMVPQLAAAARHIVAANGHGGAVTVHGAKSTELDAAALGGPVELLVCEIVDDMLLGESILTTIVDARRRLLVPRAPILPRGGTLWALAVEMLPPSHGGLDLSEMHSEAAIQTLTMQPIDSVKLQHHPRHHRVLAPPLRLFDFDWARGALDSVATPRRSPPLPLEISAVGTLTAFVIYFDLDLDGNRANRLSTGPASPNRAWDQSTRFLPVGCEVRPGDALTVVASHSECHLATLALAGYTADALGSVGLPELVGLPGAAGLTVAMAPPVAPARV